MLEVLGMPHVLQNKNRHFSIYPVYTMWQLSSPVSANITHTRYYGVTAGEAGKEGLLDTSGMM